MQIDYMLTQCFLGHSLTSIVCVWELDKANSVPMLLFKEQTQTSGGLMLNRWGHSAAYVVHMSVYGCVHIVLLWIYLVMFKG